MLYYERFVSIFISSWEVYDLSKLLVAPSCSYPIALRYKNFFQSQLYYIVNRFNVFFLTLFIKNFFLFLIELISKKKKKFLIKEK